MDLTPITDAILLDAEKRAEKIKEDAYRRIEMMKADATEELEHIRRDFEEKLSEEIDRMYSAQNAQLRDLEKTALLKVKADAAHKAAYGAAEQISNSEDVEYLKFIKTLVKRVELEGNARVYMNERDKKRISPKLFLPAKMADTCIETMGGFRIIGKDVDYDMTLEALLAESLDEISDRTGRLFSKGAS